MTTQARLRVLPWRRILTLAGIVAWVAVVLAMPVDAAADARGYFGAAWPDPYRGDPATPSSYLYSPAFLQVIEPLRALGWPAFVTIVRLAGVAALVVALGPLSLVALAVLPLPLEIWFANVNLLLGLAIVASPRRPELWALPLLTKVTPGVGLLWYLGARDLRGLGRAVLVAAAIALVSFAFAPEAWWSWGRFLLGSSGDGAAHTPWLVPRIVLGAALAFVAGRRRWPELLLVGAWIALPILWLATLSILAPLPPLLWRRYQARVRPAAPPASRSRALP